jgi:hypothetical protein
MDFLPVVGWGIKHSGTAAQRANFFASWGLLGDAPAPSAVTFYSIPTMPYMPSMPNVGRMLIYLLLIGVQYV